MIRSLSIVTAAVICFIGGFQLQAATVTNVFTEHFDDATLEAGVINQNGTPIAGGVADLNGTHTSPGTAQGFTFSNSAFDDGTTSWIMEARLVDGTTGVLDTFFDFNGDLNLRKNGVPQLRIGGPAYSFMESPVPFPTDGDHVAMVFTDGVGTLAYYLNGDLIETVAIAGFPNGNTNGFMSFGHSAFIGAAQQRGFGGSFDAIAFSTFTGTFNGGAEFALIPEPHAIGLAFIGFFGIGVVLWRRKTRVLG